MRRLVSSFLCLAFLFASSFADYDDGTVKCSLTYERAPCKDNVQEGKAVLTVEATKVPKGRPTVSLTAVFDVSKSMDTSDSLEPGQKTRLDAIKLANEYVIDRLAMQAEDHLYGSVVFSTDVEDLTPLQKLTTETAEPVKKKISEVESFGFTDLLGGILHGIKQQAEVSNADHVRAVLVFTDGKPTVGEIEPERIYKAIKEARDAAGKDILIHVIAVGDVNYDLLRGITHIGGGDFYHVSNEDDIPRAFAAVLGGNLYSMKAEMRMTSIGLMTEAAMNLKYEIKPIGDLEIVEVRSMGAQIVWHGRNVAVHLNDMFVEESRVIVIIYRMPCPMHEEDGMDIRGDYRDPVKSEDVDMEFGISYPKNEIEALPPKKGPGLPSVWDFRQDVAENLKKPAKCLEDGDVDGAIGGIEDIVVDIVSSENYKDPFVQKVVGDLEDMRDIIDEKGEDTGRGMLEGLIGVVGGGRPASVDHGTLDTVKEGLTSMQEGLIDESEGYINGTMPEEMFDMPSTTDVSVDETKEVPEYKMKISVSPPIIKEKPPLSVTVVVDKDANNPDSNATFAKMKDVLEEVIEDLETSGHPNVSLGVVMSSGTAKPVLELTNLTDIDVDKLVEDIEDFEPTGRHPSMRFIHGVSIGGSALGSGLEEAIGQQANDTQHKGQHSVVVITDGSPVDKEKIVEDVKNQLDASPHPVEIHTFGVNGSDTSLLKNISEAGGGDAYDVPDVEELGPNVGEEVWKLQSVEALNTTVEVKPAEEGVVIKGSTPKMTEKNGTFIATIPKVYEGETLDILATVDAPNGTEKLANVTLSYKDVGDGEIKTSSVQEIEAKPKGSTATRELELKVVEDLKPATEEELTPETFPAAIEPVYKAIREVEEADGVDEKTKHDLVEDLETIATKLETSQNGTEDEVHDAEDTMHSFVDTVEKQRSEGIVEPVLHTQDQHEPVGMKREIEKYVPPPTPEKEAKKLPEPLKLRFKDVVPEVTTEEQELTVKMEIEADKIVDDDTSPTSYILLVDASEATTLEDIQKVKGKTLSIWEANRGRKMANASHLEVLVFSNDVHPHLHNKTMSEIDEDIINNAFNFTDVGGKGNLPYALDLAMKMAKHIQQGDPKHDVQIIPFVAGSTNKTSTSAEVEAFVKQAEDLGYPFKLQPVMMENGDASYFDAYPPWVQHSVVPDVCKFDAEKPSSPTIARRVTLIPNENPDVEVLGVEGGIKDDKGYAIPDMAHKEKRTVDVKLKLPEGNSTQILRMPLASMWDMRTRKKHTVHGDPLTIPRKTKEEEEELQEVRSKIKDSALTIDNAVAGEHWPKVLEQASEAIGTIEESGVEDPEVDLVQEKLDILAKDVYKIVGEGKDPEGAKILSKSILDEVGKPESKEPSVVPEIPEIELLDKEEMWPGKKEGPGYSKEPQKPPELVPQEGGIFLKETDKTKKIPLKIRAPKHKGDLVDSQVLILMDGSADADWDHERDLANTMLESLANRQGKRAVGIWTWNDGIREVYFEEDFNPDALNPAKAAIDAASLGGVVVPKDVLKLIDDIKPINNTVTVCYWMSTTQLPEIDDVDVQACIDTLKRPKTPTVIVFEPKEPLKDYDPLHKIAKASGGHSIPIFPMIPETDVSNELREGGWKAVDWIEKAYTKNAKVKIGGKDGAKVTEISVDGEPVPDVEQGIDIPTMQFGEEKDIEVVVDTSDITKPEAGIQDLVHVDGDFPYVRAGEPGKMNESISVEKLHPKESSKVDMMHKMRDSAGWDLFYYLGRNRLKRAKVTAEEMHMQPKISGLEHRPDMQRLAKAYKAVEDSIQTYMDNKTNYKAIQNVADLACTYEEEIPHYSDQGAFLEHKIFPPSMSSSDGLYRPRVTVETPPWERALPWKLYDQGQEIISIAAVFDTADHGLLIDREIQPLMVQKMTVERIVKLFAENKYLIDVQAIFKIGENISSLPVKRFDIKNVDEIHTYLDPIEQKGRPTNLVSSLNAGLPFIRDAVDSERLVFLFINGCTLGEIREKECEQALMPYITYPINPVKVLTFVVGQKDGCGEDKDPISELTGGKRMYINHVDDILDVVDESVHTFSLHAARSVRVDVKSKNGGNEKLEISVDGEKRPSGIVGDLPHGAVKYIDLETSLDASHGDEDILDYVVSYYRPKYKRWFKTPNIPFRARRATNEVIKQQDAIRGEIVPILDLAISHLQMGEFSEAASTVHKASTVAHRSLYQDDSLIRAIFDYLARCYEDILKLSESQFEDAIDIEIYMKKEGCALGMDVGGECDADLESLEYPDIVYPPPFIVVY